MGWDETRQEGITGIREFKHRPTIACLEKRHQEKDVRATEGAEGIAHDLATAVGGHSATR